MLKKPILGLALAAIATLLLAGVAGAEKATVVRAGNLVLRLNGGVTPKALPKKRPAPITLHASAGVSTVDGSHPPAAKTVTIDFDKQGSIDARGLPVCRAAQLQARDTRAAKKACPDAIVGHGKTTVEVAFAEQAPFSSSGPLLFFNGGVHHGVTTMYVHAYVNVPTPTAIVTTVRVRKIHRGPYGTEAVATIPKIAGGSGSVTKFNFAIHRIFRRHGKKQSYLTARCGSGRFVAHATVEFDDGTAAAGSIVRRCEGR
jgi:hypothetical protein